MKKFVLFTIVISFFVIFTIAQNSRKSERPDIITSIESNSKTVVKQDPKLDKLIDTYLNKQDNNDADTYEGAGYRVQVFSSNEQKTAKSEAYSIEQKLRNAFPEQSVYRIYVSPFWKVRIGDFRTLQDAQTFRNELVKAFPELRKDTYTVRESKVVTR